VIRGARSIGLCLSVIVAAGKPVSQLVSQSVMACRPCCTVGGPLFAQSVDCCYISCGVFIYCFSGFVIWIVSG
jgi:hypothetical protein